MFEWLKKITGVKSTSTTKMTINGIEVHCKNLVIYADDKKVEIGEPVNIHVEVHGDCHEVSTMGTVSVRGDAGGISTMGRVTAGGNTGRIATQGKVEVGQDVNGDISTMGKVDVRGSVKGSIDTMGKVTVGRES